MNPKIIILAMCNLLIALSCTEKGIAPPMELVISEGFEDPIGFYDSTPTFSWKLPVSKKIIAQTAYTIVVASDPKLLPNDADIWNSGKVESGQSTWIKYNGTPLNSRQKAYWCIKYWDQDGNPSSWSNLANFEIGLLHTGDWKGKWISLPENEVSDTTDSGFLIFRPQYLRTTFDVPSSIKSARLYITAKGVFEAQINGEKIGDAIMPPGWTPYTKRIETLTYDVSDLIEEGLNSIGIVLAEGWHTGRLLFIKEKRVPADLPEMICQLELSFENGDKMMLVSDNKWKVTQNGPIRMSEIYDGEIYDANFELPGWSTTVFDDSEWLSAEEKTINPEVNLEPKRHYSVTNKLFLPVIELTHSDSGLAIFDLGQNMVGVAKVNVPMNKGGKLKIRFAEMLNKDGSMYTENYRTAKSTDYYIAKEDGTIDWQPSFTFHGFRYVELSGFDSALTPEKNWVTGIVQHSDFKITGSFTSSHEKLNQLQSNIIWGLRGNFFDIPTDCPQRNERLGWTGDAQVFASTSIYNADVHSFWMSWLQSMREEQGEDGRIPIVVPNDAGDWVSSGWGDAATVIPWEIYLRTGDKNVLAENYDMMIKWVNFYHSISKNHIVNDMFSFGDWLQPFSKNIENERLGETPNDLISTAYFAKSTKLTMLAAGVLGFNEDSLKLSSLFDSIAMAFENRYFDKDGRLSIGKETQTGYLLAIGFNLLSAQKEQQAIPHLINQINLADNHLRTGFLGTPLLAPVLDKIGRTDLMYEVLFKETYPSWFYSINQGATTMWERWNSYSHEDGFGNASMNSFNHYAYGAIGQWMYERIAGVSPLEAGFKRIKIAPIPGGPLKSAQLEYTSPYGKILSNWNLDNDKFSLHIVIPPNTTAMIIMPANTEKDLLINGEKPSTIQGAVLTEKQKNSFVLNIQPGSYELISFF